MKCKVKMTLRRVRLNRDGYIRSGQDLYRPTYFGIGAPLYFTEVSEVTEAENKEDASYQFYYLPEDNIFRAADRDHAKEIVRNMMAKQFGDMVTVTFHN